MRVVSRSSRSATARSTCASTVGGCGRSGPAATRLPRVRRWPGIVAAARHRVAQAPAPTPRRAHAGHGARLRHRRGVLRPRRRVRGRDRTGPGAEQAGCRPRDRQVRSPGPDVRGAVRPRHRCVAGRDRVGARRAALDRRRAVRRLRDPARCCARGRRTRPRLGRRPGIRQPSHEPVDVARESFEIQRALARDGWEIARYSGASFKILVTEADVTRGLDVFGGFIDAGRLYLMGEVGLTFERDWIYPLATAELDGRKVPVPARPDKLLEAMYGAHWRTPDPAFKFSTPERTIRAFDDWFRGTQPGCATGSEPRTSRPQAPAERSQRPGRARTPDSEAARGRGARHRSRTGDRQRVAGQAGPPGHRLRLRPAGAGAGWIDR